MPESLVDITRVPGMKGIRREGDVIHIGPATTFSELVESPIIRDDAFLLAQAALSVGSPQIRNRGTVGGNIVKGSPAADSVPSLMALEAKLRLVSKAGERELSLEEFLVGICKTTIEPGEVLAGISFQALAPRTRQRFCQVGPTQCTCNFAGQRGGYRRL